MPYTLAIILAAGSGNRLSSDIPKQFSKIAGRTVLEHTVQQFDSHPGIDAIIIVIPPRQGAIEYDLILTRIAETSTKPITMVTGGTTRNQSTLRALRSIGRNEAQILIHDAARPLITADIISRCIAGLEVHRAVDTVIDCADTIVAVNEAMEIVDVPDRRALRRGQTPQAFHLDVLRSAYRAAQAAGDLVHTDDCGVVLKYRPDVVIGCIDGSTSNIKITHPIDLITADRLFQLRSSEAASRSSQDRPDPDLNGSVIVVFGSSSGIGCEIGSMAMRLGAHVHGFSLTHGDVDIRDERRVEVALSKVARSEGRIDAVINAAGVLGRGRLQEASIPEIRASLETNLVGAFVVAKLSYRFLQHTRGHLVFFTSSSYTRGRASYAAYSAAKAGVVNLAQALADEWDDVKVNCINPERTATRMRALAFPDEDPDTLLPVADVAAATLSLLTTDVTGQVIDVRRPPTAAVRHLGVLAQ
jgi:2-C-methyl-D-erythritol 4-phosphate cytidylyltransferase